MTKMTYVDALNYALTNCEMPKEVFERLTDLRDANVKRSSERKPTAKQTENIAIKTNLMIAMYAFAKYVTIDDIRAKEEFAGMSTQKLSALLSQLMKEGKIVREEFHHKPHFRAV